MRHTHVHAFKKIQQVPRKVSDISQYLGTSSKGQIHYLSLVIILGLDKRPQQVSVLLFPERLWTLLLLFDFGSLWLVPRSLFLAMWGEPPTQQASHKHG